MSANNASLYESDDSSYTAPNKQIGGNSLYDAAGAAIDQPINYKGLGLKAKQIVEGSGPLQPPIGQTIAGAAKDVDQNLLGGYGDYIVPAAVGIYGLKKLWDKFGPNDNNTPPPPPPGGGPATPPAAGPVAPTQPQLSPLEQQKLRILELKAKKEELSLQSQQQKFDREQANYEAKQAQQAAKAKQSSGGTMTESDMKMLAASENAKITKAVIADQKAQQAAAATKQSQAAIVPDAVAVEAASPTPLTEATQLKTGTGKPAFQGMSPEGKLQKSYSSIKDVPANMAFVPGAQYVDVLRNDLSQPTYTEQFRTKEWPSVYEQAIEEAKGINRSLGRETRAALLAKGVPKEELPKPTEGIFQKIGGKHGSKAVRVGGVVGALTTIPNLVNAQTLGQAADIISDVAVPPFAQSREAGMPKSEEEKLLASKFKEAKKLGSPYRSVPPPK